MRCRRDAGVDSNIIEQQPMTETAREKISTELGARTGDTDSEGEK